MKIQNVVLLNPPMRIEEVFGSFSEWGGACPPTGLCYIASFMRQAGYRVSIVDAEALRLDCREAADAVAALRPDSDGSVPERHLNRVPTRSRPPSPPLQKADLLHGIFHLVALPVSICPSPSFIFEYLPFSVQRSMFSV